ncbi:hypothetical protein DPMN_079746 [Dreissena polymorpha]|uniref:Uncharacterized protein n=1 Tax=Dreissena polymorpha TaxID=45954 RepID=A0A9D3YPK4_DREPO|nr:hypothetical protein DPMN_079746 [Dreissena polymorpha]
MNAASNANAISTTLNPGDGRMERRSRVSKSSDESSVSMESSDPSTERTNASLNR